MLVGVTRPPATLADTEAEPRRARALVDTAGADVVERVLQRRTRPIRRPTSAGARSRSCARSASAVDADTVVFDDDLSPGPAAQPRADPRADRDRPHRGDPRHLRPEREDPRRAGPRSSSPCSATAFPACEDAGAALSQQAGGIGTRGPGETDPRGRPAAPAAADGPARGRPAPARPHPAHPATRAGTARAIGRSPSSATPTPGSRPC